MGSVPRRGSTSRSPSASASEIRSPEWYSTAISARLGTPVGALIEQAPISALTSSSVRISTGSPRRPLVSSALTPPASTCRPRSPPRGATRRPSWRRKYERCSESRASQKRPNARRPTPRLVLGAFDRTSVKSIVFPISFDDHRATSPVPVSWCWSSTTRRLGSSRWLAFLQRMNPRVGGGYSSSPAPCRRPTSRPLTCSATSPHCLPPCAGTQIAFGPAAGPSPPRTR